MSHTMPSIHFVERKENWKCVNPESNEWESGYWVVSKKAAEKLIGGSLYLHAGQNEPSFCGGKIIGYRKPAQSRRVIFLFQRDSSHEGVITPQKGWGNEQKRVGLKPTHRFLSAHTSDAG